MSGDAIRFSLTTTHCVRFEFSKGIFEYSLAQSKGVFTA